MTARRVLLTLCAAAAALAAAACGDDVPETRPATTVEPRTYTFVWSGDEAELPWNRTLYPDDAKAGQVDATHVAYFFEGEPGARVSGLPGARWGFRSELDPSRAMERILWIFRAEGRYGDDATIRLPAQPRAQIAFTGTDATAPGGDWLSVVDEEEGCRLVAMRDPLRALRFALWDASADPPKDDWRVVDHTAPTRPWAWGEVRPGKFVIAARCEGHQWVARRVDLRAGAVEAFDVLAQPAGGGTVICENPRAELLLGGDLPVAPLRLTQDFLRARWDGVPPGRHVVRYPGGRRLQVEVADGGAIKLPRD